VGSGLAIALTRVSAGEGAGEACEPHVADGATWIVEENSVAAVAATVASSPNAVRNADLITVTIGVNQIVHIAFANGCAASACARAEREFERQYTSLLNRLTELRPASKAAYRLLTEYNLPASSTVRRLLRLPPPDPTATDSRDIRERSPSRGR
jgi:hypothetical protein